MNEMNPKEGIVNRSLGGALDSTIAGPSSALNEMEMYSNVYDQIPNSEISTERNCSYNTGAFRKEAPSPSGSKKYEKKAEKYCVCPIVCLLVISIVIACVAASLSTWSFLEVRKKMFSERNCSCVNTEQKSDTSASNSSYLEVDTFSLWNENITNSIRNLQNEVNFFSLQNSLYVDTDTFTLWNQNITQLIGTLQDQVAVLSFILHDSFISIGMISEHCGPGLWKRVVSLNMSNSSQQCPSEWMEFSSPTRSCGRPNTVAGCNQVSLTVGIQFSRVCGRAIARTLRTADAFSPASSSRDNENYVDGLSVTHSSPRQHIWTFAADQTIHFRCPCNGFSSIPSFVGDNYFCDSSGNGALWDGEGCVTGLSCCTFNSPPWFSAQLPAPTSDDIDVRICTDEEVGNENIHVELMELYVQ